MTQSDLSTEEAKRRHLPLSEYFRGSHLMYFDDCNKNCCVVSLNMEAYKAFSDTVLVRNRAQLKVERKSAREWRAGGGQLFTATPPSSPAGFAILKYMNLEFLKLGCGFELHLRARLLFKGYVVHDINGKDRRFKHLAKAQKDRPVKVADMLTIDPFRFDGRENYMPGLKRTSIQFSVLTKKPGYRMAMALPEETMAIIEEYRKLRNQIHLPGDSIVFPKQMRTRDKSVSEFIFDFVNKEIVDWTNQIISCRGFRFPSLSRVLD